MKITQLTAKPKLIKIELLDDEIRQEYGEAIEFWIWDRHPMKKFMKLASLKEEDYGDMIGLVEELVLDEQGNRILSDDNLLPTKIMTKVVQRVVETLGK